LTPRYILIQTGRNLKQTWGTQLMTLITVSLSVFMFSFFFLVYVNMLNTGERLGKHIRLIIYLDNEVGPEMQEQLTMDIRKFSEVEKIVFKTRQDAFTDLSGQLDNDRDVLFDLGADFLPPSIEVFPKRDLKSLSQIKRFSDYLATLPGVLKVQYGREWIERFGSFTQLVQLIVVCSGVLLILTATFMVASTIRLTVVSRQNELEILRLLGATQAYFQTPLLLEGIIQGVAGSIIGLTCLYSMYTWMHIKFSGPSFLEIFQITFLPGSVTFAIFSSSVILCTIGSYISIRKFLRI
jgi:cell division transport system permease protein